jgi:hypothetical protein
METRSHKNDEVPLFIRALMPGADVQELMEAHQTAKDYVDIVVRIFERAARETGTTDSLESQPHSRIRTE